jgi:hypothetical protein
MLQLSSILGKPKKISKLWRVFRRDTVVVERLALAYISARDFFGAGQVRSNQFGGNY